MARQPLGQHFLSDLRARADIVRAVPVRPDACIVEIGPGRGAITHALAKKIASATNASFICIERDAALAEALETRYRATKTVRIIHGDVRKELPELVAAGTIAAPYAVVGNIPYYLTGRLLRVLGELPTLPYAAVLTVQREVAERIAATPPRMNLLAAMVGGWAQANIIRTIPKGAFQPPPRVESAVVLFEATRSTPPPESYIRVAKALFRQPRQTALNNLARIIPRDTAHSLLLKAGLDTTARPHTFSLKKIANVAQLLPTEM